jgi:hypothetical protein
VLVVANVRKVASWVWALSFVAVLPAEAQPSEEYQLELIASIYVGTVSAQYSRETDRTGSFATLVSGPRRLHGETREEQSQRITDAQPEIDAVVERLEQIADVDGSGEVSMEETSALVKVFMFGVKYESIAKTEGRDPSVLSAVYDLPIEELKTAVVEYNEFVVACRQVGLDKVEELKWYGREN